MAPTTLDGRRLNRWQNAEEPAGRYGYESQTISSLGVARTHRRGQPGAASPGTPLVCGTTITSTPLPLRRPGSIEAQYVPTVVSHPLARRFRDRNGYNGFEMLASESFVGGRD
jgi:hypothetical protein